MHVIFRLVGGMHTVADLGGGCIPPTSLKVTILAEKSALVLNNSAPFRDASPPHRPKPNESGRKISLNFGEASEFLRFWLQIPPTKIFWIRHWMHPPIPPLNPPLAANTAKIMESFPIFNCFACFWPKGYQCASLGKSHQNGDYLKQAMRKSCLPTGFESAAFGLPVHCSTICAREDVSSPA